MVESSPNVNGNQKECSSKVEEKKVTNSVPFHKLFSFADSTDVFLMIVGTIGAVGSGLGFPIMTILFAQLADAFGKIHNDRDVVVVVHTVSEVDTLNSRRMIFTFSLICTDVS